MNADSKREAAASPATGRAERVSETRVLQPFGPSGRGLVVLLSLLFLTLSGPATAGLSCDDWADCEVRIDRSAADTAAPWYRLASTNSDGPIGLDGLEGSRRRLTMKQPDDLLNPVEFEICGPQPLVDIFVEELEYHSKDLKKFDIYEVIAIIKEYFPCD